MGKNSTEEKIKEIAREVSKATEPVIKEAKKAAEPIIRDVKEAAKPYTQKAEPYLKDIKGKAEPYIKDIKDKAAPVYSDVKTKAEPYIKDIKEKAEPYLNKAKEKAAKTTCKEEVFVQYNHHEIKTADIIDRAKKDYVSKGHKATSIKEIQVYIKPSDNAAYYVVNHTDTGKVEF